jgi:hypothetical protein
MDKKVEITPEQYAQLQKLIEKEEKAKLYAKRQAVKNQIILEKAKKQNITATPAEIEARMKADEEVEVEEGQAA